MVIDCFTFYNELELLEIRLEELKEVVNWFILIEAAETYSGKPKEFVFDASKSRFEQYPIRHIKIPRFPVGLVNAWQREEYTRNTLSSGLQGLDIKQDDVIMLSDIDEIPRADVVADCASKLTADSMQPVFVLEQILSYYYVNCRAAGVWQGSRMTRYDHLGKFHDLRASQGISVPNAGWHFSYLGGADRVRQKIGASIHTELDQPQFTNASHLEECITQGTDLFGRNVDYHFVSLDESFPRHIIDNQSKYAHLIGEKKYPSVEQQFFQACHTPSDINEHLDYLFRLASTVNHVTEFGTRFGGSTKAFIYARPKRLISYDIEPRPVMPAIEAGARDAGVEFCFKSEDVLNAEIEETDLLFIDTWHVESQMREELRLHANKVLRYLVMHDTVTFGTIGESSGHRGIWFAIAEFIKSNPEWFMLHHFNHNNGLTVFERRYRA